MPTVRYQIRNEYGLADPELYKAADKDDPEALLEGVAMAGLVGVLRQLGDLAEFAAEIFHDLHEEVTATAARGYGLMLRVQQLEAEFPSIEKAFLSQTSHSCFAYNEGIDWHANLRMDQNLVTQGDMPRFILDSYEECRGPPRLFMLDKFDVAGAGACLKRYSDPSFFKVNLSSSGMMEEEVRREKKARKTKKRGSRWRNGETTESFLVPLMNSNLQSVTSDRVWEYVPTRRVKLKSRNLIDSDTTNRRSYMERLLEVHSPEQKVLSENCISHPPIMIKSIDSSESAPEIHEIVLDTTADSPIIRDRNPTQSPTKQEVAYFPTNELKNQKISVEMLENIPEQKILTKSITRTEVGVDGYLSDEAEKSPPALPMVDQKKSFSDAEFTTQGGFNGFSSDDKSKTEVIVDGYRSDEAEKSPASLPAVDQKKSLADAKFTTEGGYDDYKSDDICSDLDNYIDALNTMESETETDSESRAKSDPGFNSMGTHGIDSGIKERQQELPAQFSEPGSVENSTALKGLNNMLNNEVSSLSNSDSSGNLAATQPSQENTSSLNVPAIPEIFLDETHNKTPEQLQRNVEIRESIASFHLLPDETCNAKESDVTSLKSEIGEAYSGSCVTDSTSSPFHVCPQVSDEAQSVTLHPKETFSGYVEDTHEVAQQLDGNVEVLSNFSENSDIFSDELLQLSDMAGPPLWGKDVPEETHPIEYANEAQSVTVYPNETFSGYVEGTHEVAEQLDGNMEEVSKFADSSNIFPDQLVLLSDREGSSLMRKDVPEETHHAEHAEEQISDYMADRLGMLDHLSQTLDESILNEAPTECVEGSLLTVEETSYIGEQQQSIEQETEACSGESISPTIPGFSLDISSTVVQPHCLDADMENVEQPEDLALEISSNDVKGTLEDVRDYGKLLCTVETSELPSQAYDGMAFPKPASISSDDLLLVSDIPEKTNTAEDAEEVFSEDMANTRGESIPEEVPTACVKDSSASFTEQDTEACLGEKISATKCDISLEVSPIITHLDGLVADIENLVAPGEDSNADDVGQSKILLPSIMPLEFEHLSDAEEPQESCEVDSAEILPLSSGSEAFSDAMQLQSNESVSVVIDGPEPVADNLGFLGSTVSNLHKDALQIEKFTECDDSLSECVIVEADDGNQGPCSICSLEASGFDVQLHEDCLPGDAILDQHNLQINEASGLKNITGLPQNEEQPVSFPAVSSYELPILDSSYSSDAKVLGGVCHLMRSEPNVGKEILIYSSENEDSGSKEGMSPSTHFLVEPAIPLQVGNEQNVIASHQEGEHLEAPDIQFEGVCSVEHHITQSNSKDIDDQLSEPEPHAIVSNGEINALGIPPSNTGIHEQPEAETSVPSECTSEISVGSLASHISDAGLPLIASSSAVSFETSPQESSEPWPGEPTSGFQSQDVEKTPPLPPLPPVEWRMGKLRLGSLTPGGDTAQPPIVTNPFMEISTMDKKHPQGSVITGVEMIQPANPFAALRVLVDERFQHGILTSEGEIARPSRLSELPLIVDEERHQHGTLFLEEGMVNPSNPFLIVSHPEDEKYSSGHDAPVPALEGETTQHPQLLQREVRSMQDNRPQLGQLLPSLELERSQHETSSIERDPILPLNPFLVVSSTEEWKHQYGYGVYGGESMQHVNLSVPLPVTGPNMHPYGFLYSMGENPSTVYDYMVPAMEGEKPNWKHRSIRDRPRDPLIEAVAAHDKSMLRKISELDRPSARPKADERDSFLEQIRSKSFNLKPANASKPNMKGPQTNLKVAAILEKANKIRQAFVGSDEDDDDDGDTWTDS